MNSRLLSQMKSLKRDFMLMSFEHSSEIVFQGREVDGLLVRQASKVG
jgi:hypothetical protein